MGTHVNADVDVDVDVDIDVAVDVVVDVVVYEHPDRSTEGGLNRFEQLLRSLSGARVHM